MDRNNRRERETSEAAHWWNVVVLGSSEELSSSEREEFMRWLHESPANVAELLHMAHVHDTLGRFNLWNEVKAELENASKEAPAVVPFADYRAADDQAVASQPLQKQPRAKRWLRPVALAAAITAMAVAWVFLPGYSGQTIATAHGERRSVMLKDGSVVQLDPETTLRVQFGTHERRIVLERGRALFHVAKDAQRAFLVAANETLVHAVGTVFGVEERADHNVVVTVAEGRVAVLPRIDPASAGKGDEEATPSSRSGPKRPQTSMSERSSADPIYLSAGKQVTIATSGIEPVRAVDAGSELSWAEGHLVFVSTPLGEALEEFNRYTHVRLSVRDEALAQRPISGVFDVSDPESFIAFIKAGTAADVLRVQDRIVITPAEKDAAKD